MEITRPQFRLRTALLAIGLVAVFCALIANWITRGEQQRTELERHREQGTNIGYKVDPNSMQGKVAEAIGIDMVAAPKELFCNSPRNEPVDIDAIIEMKSVEHLVLGMTGVSDDDLASLDQMPNLKYLHLSHTGITDDGIANLIDLNLVSLHIDNLVMTDASVESIAKIKSLKWLNCTSGAFSDAAISNLKTKLPACRINFSK